MGSIKRTILKRKNGNSQIKGLLFTWSHDRVHEHDGKKEGDSDPDDQTQAKFHFLRLPA
jgi:hypothetical protein